MKNKKISYKKIFIFAIIAYFSWILIGQSYAIKELKDQKNDIANKTAAVNAQKEKLKVQCESQNTKEYIEKIARKSLGLVYPDERIYMDAYEK